MVLAKSYNNAFKFIKVMYKLLLLSFLGLCAKLLSRLLMYAVHEKLVTYIASVYILGVVLIKNVRSMNHQKVTSIIDYFID